MSIALHIAPSNRFVLRSATRLYIHVEKPEKALFFLRRSEVTKHDPWLLSAHIATSAIMERHSPLIKNGMGVLQSRHFTDFDKTELASSIGTLELKNGSFKKAKTFIDQSLVKPNDNSLAQLEWLSQEDNRFILPPSAFRNVANPFEALALDFFNKGLWNDAFKSTLNWYLDLPYSKRPVILGSYIACGMKQDYEAAITLCEVGLRSNPGDAEILNNIVYAYAKLDKINEAGNYLKQFLNLVKNGQLDNENRVSFQATLGLVLFRSGDVEQAKNHYKNAIMNAEKMGDSYLRGLATVNFAYELVKNNDPEKGHYLSLVGRIKETAKELDLLAMIEGIEELAKKLEA
jgi:tetratricopeptide (TPR) repeat protein